MNRKQFKKLICLLLVMAAMVSLFSGCKKKGGVEISSAGYLAQGTIPAAAKIYPIVNENIPMDVLYTGVDSSLFSEEDIAEIVTKEDRYDALCFNNAAKDYNSSEKTFCDVQKVIENNEQKGSHTVLNGAQIMVLEFKSETTAETLTLVKSTGTIDGREGTFYSIGQVWWEIRDGQWYITGSANGFNGSTSLYDIEKDAVNGKINVIER